MIVCDSYDHAPSFPCLGALWRRQLTVELLEEDGCWTCMLVVSLLNLCGRSIQELSLLN